MNVSPDAGPRAGVLLIASMNLAQLPGALRAVVLVLLGHYVTGSYALAGAGAAAAAISSAVTAPGLGRLLSGTATAACCS